MSSLENEPSPAPYGARELELLIEKVGDEPEYDETVFRLIEAGSFLVLGDHDWDGWPSIMCANIQVQWHELPSLFVFTGHEHVDAALWVCPGWFEWSILEMDGPSILSAVPRGHWIVINPFTACEFKHPPLG